LEERSNLKSVYFFQAEATRADLFPIYEESEGIVSGHLDESVFDIFMDIKDPAEVSSFPKW
jgi:hypothetical protein